MSKLQNPWLLIYLFTPLLALNLSSLGENHYTYLAYAFQNGSLSYLKIPPTLVDLVYFEGKFYWPLGPFPAIALIPFVSIFGTGFPEWHLKLPLTILNFFLITKIASALKLPSNKAVLLAIFFIFGSIYTPVAALAYSTYFAQVIGTSLLLFAIWEFFARRRWLVISTTLALATLTRAELVLANLFFLILLFQKSFNLKNLLKFALPLVIVCLFYLTYNYLRFKNPLEVGFLYLIEGSETTQLKTFAKFSIYHIPANLYYMLLKGPDPIFDNNTKLLKPPYIKADEFGLNIFLLSPILLLTLFANWQKRVVRAALLTILLMTIPLITFYGGGSKQIGFRYALGFYPFLLPILASSFKNIDTKILASLIILGVIITWYLIFVSILI